jgi:hypothetical protein
VPSDSNFHVEANPMPEHRQLNTDPAVLVLSIDLSILRRQNSSRIEKMSFVASRPGLWGC